MFWLSLFVVAGGIATTFAGGNPVNFALIFLVLLAFGATGFVSGAVAATGELAGALAGASALTRASAVAFLGTAGSAIAVGLLDRLGRPRFARLLLTAIAILAVPAIAVSLDWTTVSEDRRSLFLFLAVLPLLNALFDVVSYAVTLTLIRRGLRAKLPFLLGLADLGLACVLLLGLGATLVAVIHGLNVLAGVPFLDLPALFAGVQADPWAYTWLYLMLFSTLLPTLLHALLSLLGVQGIWPKRLRRPVADWVAAAPTSPLTAVRASVGLSVIWAVPLLLLGAVLWAFWHIGGDALLRFLAVYLDALIRIAGGPVGAF
jgi:hypothetical protein